MNKELVERLKENNQVYKKMIDELNVEASKIVDDEDEKLSCQNSISQLEHIIAENEKLIKDITENNLF